MNQIKSLEKTGYKVDYLFEKGEFIYIKEGNKEIKLCKNFKNNIINNHNIFLKLLFIKYNFKNYNLLYFRYRGNNIFLLIFLFLVKTSKIMEIPTYPFKGERLKSNLHKLIYHYENFFNFFLKKCIYKIITFSEDEKIFGIECINIFNGINFEEIDLIEKNTKKGKIVFTSVSVCNLWHGIDRFLISLEKYFEKGFAKEIIFNIVGEGPETVRLKKIVNDSKYLSNAVVFHGFKSGQELDEIYNTTNIGVGCLGNHRKGIYTIQALKNKEYAAKGLPIIFSEDDPGLRNKEYVYRATHDEKLLDIDNIINWYQNLKITPEEIRESVKEFSWDNQMKKIIDIFEEK